MRLSGCLSQGRETAIRNSVIAGLAVFCGGIAGTTPAAATTPSNVFDLIIGYAGFQTSRVGLGAVHSNLQTIRDGIQRVMPNGSSSRPLGFAAADDDELGPDVLGYAARRKGGRMPLKAPPMPASAPVRYAIWGQGFVDREWRDGFFGGADIGRRTTTYGGLVGLDAIISGVGIPNDALVVGVLGGYTESKVHNNNGSTGRVEGPSIGFYGAYVFGQYSVDAVYKVDFFDVNQTTPGAAPLNVDMTNHVFALNFNNRVQLRNAWWVEPTVGFSHTSSDWSSAAKALGYEDGTEVRVQGGARAGTVFQSGSMQLEPTFTGLLYSPIIVEGGSVAGVVPAAPSDQGKLFGSFNAKLNAIWDRYWSSYLEGEVRGSNNVLGAAGRLGARYAFNP
jgi:hypothetical protein